MIRRSLLVLLCVLATDTGLACATQEAISQLRQILETDPHKAVVDAIAERDLRFLALDRDQPQVPGLAPHFQRYREIYGTRILPATTGRPCDAQHADLVRRAFNYAERYNLLLLEWLRQVDMQSLRGAFRAAGVQPADADARPWQPTENNPRALHGRT